MVLNGDDELVAYVGSHKANAIFYGLTAHDQLYVTAHPDAGSLAGLTGRLQFDQTEYPFKAPALAGDFNLYNILAAASLTYMLGLDPAAICAALATFVGVPGRMEKYELPNGAVAFIDYAHNPSSFEAILTTLGALTDDLTVVCGGDRDTAKRPVMGALAAKYAQQIIVTTDNPRSEEASDIVEQIIAGIGIADRARVTVELDREKAIQIAYSRSKKGSVIALLGKGPDEYQLIKGIKTAFSEKAILKAL